VPIVDDDDAAAGHGGPLSYVFKWLWNYQLTHQHMNALVFIALTHIAVGVVCALVF
jgi:hypothetical protein